MQFVKDWILWVQSCLDFFPSVYLGSLFPDNLRRYSAESLQGDGPCSGEGTNYTWENRAAQVGPMEGTAEEGYFMWWVQGLHVLEPDVQPRLGQKKASESYSLLFVWKRSNHKLTCSTGGICWRASGCGDQAALFRVSVGNLLGSSADERTESMPWLPGHRLFAYCLVSDLVFQK